MPHAWAHLLPLVAALERAGNAAASPGFVATQGGYECAMTQPLDVAVLRPLVGPDDPDVHLAESSDLLWCTHCWGCIIGADRLAEVAAEGEAP
jgi:hypothetical protein